MTNAEKYLKDNVSVEEFARTICSELPFEDVMPRHIIEALNQPITPTLTEAERVILMNVSSKAKKISRDYTGDLALKGEKYFRFFTSFNHLFQFIKERRRV